MEITDVRIKLVEDSTDRLKAFCSVTFDGEFVIRDIKVVAGTNGLFVAMPSRKLTTGCPKCRHKNQLRAKYCEECGARLPNKEMPQDEDGRSRLYRDVAHPITSSFRELLQSRVVDAYEAEAAEVAEHEYDAVETEGDTDPVTAEKPSEYDSLIAGLSDSGRKGKRDEGGDRDAPRKRGRGRRDRGEGRSRGRGSDGPHGGRGREAEPAVTAHADTEDEPAQTAQTQAADEVSLNDAASEPPQDDDGKSGSTPFGLGVL